MGKWGQDRHNDEATWGQRTEYDVDSLSRSMDNERLGVFDMPSDKDVCTPECEKWERQWRNEALATKGLREFNGTGEGVRDGVSYTDSMYPDQVAGVRTGKRRNE